MFESVDVLHKWGKQANTEKKMSELGAESQKSQHKQGKKKKENN